MTPPPSLDIDVDGVTWATINPNSATFGSYSVPMVLSAGNHTIAIIQTANTTFPSAFIDDVNLQLDSFNVQEIATSYNSQGGLDSVTSLDYSGTVLNQVKNVYNGFGQLTQQYQEHNGSVVTNAGTESTLSVSYSYSNGADGSRLTQLTYPNGNTIGYNYGATGSLNDVISRLDNLSSGNSALETYKYLGLSTVVERDDGDGVNLSYIGSGTGDAGDRYVGLDRFGRVVLQAWTSGTTNIDTYAYTYDRDNNVTAMHNLTAPISYPDAYSNFDEQFTYNQLDQLTAETHYNSPTLNQSWSLDALGNILGMATDTTLTSQSVNSQNQITSVGDNALTYDNNGNLTTDDQGRTLVYDAWNRLIAVLNSDGSTIATYTYDGMGRITTQTDGDGNTTDFYYDGSQDIEERAGVSSGNVGTVTTQTIFSPVYVNAPLARNNFSSGSFSSRIFFTCDANYDVTSVIGSGGTVEQRQDYTAFGEVSFFNSSWSSTTDSYSLRELYQGMFRGAATGMYYANSGQTLYGRWLDVDLDRWITPDYGGGYGANGMNLYPFVGDNPIDHLDPTGLKRILVAFEGRGGYPGAISEMLTAHGFKLPSDAWGGDATDPAGNKFSFINHTSGGLSGNSDGVKAGIGDILKCRKADDKIAVVGYSWGGDAAWEFVSRIKAVDSLTTDLLVTYDPRPRFGNSDNPQEGFWNSQRTSGNDAAGNPLDKSVFSYSAVKPGLWINVYQKANKLVLFPFFPAPVWGNLSGSSMVPYGVLPANDHNVTRDDINHFNIVSKEPDYLINAFNQLK